MQFFANCGNETNYANCAINQILQVGQISISDGCSTVVQVDCTGGIGMGGVGYSAPYCATLILTLTAIFIENIIFEIIGPFCHVNFIYTYPGPARVISDIHNQS